MPDPVDEALEAIFSPRIEQFEADSVADLEYQRLQELVDDYELPKPESFIYETFDEFEFRAMEQLDDATSEAIWIDAYSGLIQAALERVGLRENDAPEDDPAVLELRDKALAAVFMSDASSLDKLAFARMADEFLEGISNPVFGDKEPYEFVSETQEVAKSCIKRIRQSNSNRAYANVLIDKLLATYRLRNGLHDDLEPMMRTLVNAGIDMIELLGDGRKPEEVESFLTTTLAESQQFQRFLDYEGTNSKGGIKIVTVVANRLLSYGYLCLPRYESRYTTK